MEIIYEDSDILILNKPAGLLVHPVPAKTKEDTLVDWLIKNYPSIKEVGDDPKNRPGIVHRLDRDTSGIILVTKTQLAFDFFKNLFQKRQIKKTYLAVVRGIPKSAKGTIDAPIGIKSGTTKRSIHSTKMSKPAITDYELLDSFSNDNQEYALLVVKLHTGRTHQIRVHLASIGHPIIGDKIYNKKPNFENLLLHALSLDFSNLNKSHLRLTADPPKTFTSFHPSLTKSTQNL